MKHFHFKSDKLVRLVQAFLAGALVVATFNTHDFAAARDNLETALPPVKPAELKGDIIIAGSSTVYPLTQLLGDAFKADGFAGKLDIAASSTGKGIEAFCAGGIDVANASRAMTDDEIATCKKGGREPIQLPIGADGIVIVVSRQNRFVNDLTPEQVAGIFSGKAKTWQDVNPKWPAQPIKVVSPAATHGTYDYFGEVIFGETTKDAAERKKTIAGVPGITLFEDYNKLTAAVSRDIFAVGFAGYGFYSGNRARLRAVVFDDVMPYDKTVSNKTYPIARPLYLIVDAATLKKKPQVAGFVNFALAHVNDKIAESGYFPELDKTLDETRALFVKALK